MCITVNFSAGELIDIYHTYDATETEHTLTSTQSLCSPGFWYIIQ